MQQKFACRLFDFHLQMQMTTSIAFSIVPLLLYLELNIFFKLVDHIVNKDAIRKFRNFCVRNWDLLLNQEELAHYCFDWGDLNREAGLNQTSNDPSLLA